MTRQQKKSMAALLACALFLLGSLLSVLFIVRHQDHDCTGPDCAVCAQLCAAEGILRQGAAAVAAVAFLAAALALLRPFLKSIVLWATPLTPVALKARMNH